LAAVLTFWRSGGWLKEFKFKYISNNNQCDFNESVSKDLSRIENAVTVGNLPDALHLIDNSQQEIPPFLLL
jgi:homoaconitase/3-isopropylmalate dehydratase large subunit